MGTAIKFVTSGILYTCLATVLSQGAVIAYLWGTGALDRHEACQIADVLTGVDMIRAADAKPDESSSEQNQQPSFDQILERRIARSLDLDLREQAVGKGLADLSALTTKLAEDTRRFDLRREAFRANLEKLDQDAKGSALTEVRQTLESMKPRQAKDQLIRMLDDRENEKEKMQAVVTIIKAMPLDKRKKLLAEFKTGDEPNRLAEILEQILRGVPETSVIQEAKQGMPATQP